MRTKGDIVILGAGLAGLSAAYHLGSRDYKIFEREIQPGGLCRSKKESGFVFDQGGHLIHLNGVARPGCQDKRYLLELLDRFNLQLVKHKRNSWIFYKNRYVLYPFQANFAMLGRGIAEDCMLGFIESNLKAGARSYNNGRNFYQWMLDVFGKGITNHFMFPYNKKFWTIHPQRISCDWVSEYIPQPTVKQVVDNAFGKLNKNLGYNVHFAYPQQGEIASIVKAFRDRIRLVKTGYEAELVDLIKKRVIFRNGKSIRFNRLISTIPLPNLVQIIKSPPKKIIKAARRLKYVSIFNLNLGIDREKVSDKHWIYFPEKEFSFFRVGFKSNFSQHSQPCNKSSLYIEVSYSKYKQIDRCAIEEIIINDLKKVGILNTEDKILARDVNDIKYGYIIYDKGRSINLGLILSFLRENAIYPIGRYGSWKYMSMEDVILEGKEIAEKLYT
jgi:protoporphyrinogen oxidase